MASPFPGGDTADWPDDGEKVPKNKSKRSRRTYKYGVQWDPSEFLDQAKTVEHPKDPQKSLPDVLKEAMIQVLARDPVELSKHRLQVVLAIKRRSVELRSEEQQLKSSLDPKVARVLSPKHLTLWKDLMEQTGFGDFKIFDMVCQGIPLYGVHDVPVDAPLDWRPATTSADELLETSVWRRHAIQGASSGLDLQQQHDLHEASLVEVGRGHLSSPCTENEITAAIGDPHWLFSPMQVRGVSGRREEGPSD